MIKAIALATCLIGGLAPVRVQPTSYVDWLRAYRNGEYDKARDAVVKLSADEEFARGMSECIDKARRARDKGSLEAALLLHSEIVFVGWNELDPGTNTLPGLVSLNTHLAAVDAVHSALTRIDPRGEFLRSWYLLWESYRQGHIYSTLPAQFDYLDVALRAFPEDPELLLAAGSRQELRWWVMADNPQRHPEGDAGTGEGQLRTAAAHLQKSVATRGPNPVLVEARLRLGRVLLALDRVDAAEEQLRLAEASAGDPVLKYLSHLFVGEVHERRGDLAAAAASYASAISLVPVPQSARIAAAHVAHATGQRAAAAKSVGAALSEPSKDADPWWWYIRGQIWHFEFDLERSRSLLSR
jgi:tetratricopeptide (TPR) repeat protein